MKSFVILQRAFVSLLCDSPRVLESSRWSRSDTQRLTHTHGGRFTHFLFHNGWHRSTCLVTYTEMIMSFLAICLPSAFLLVGNVAVKSCLAVPQFMPCLQTVQMKAFHNSILILHKFSVDLFLACRFALQKRLWTPHRTDARALSYLALSLIEGVLPKKEKHNVEPFILEMKHIMVPSR